MLASSPHHQQERTIIHKLPSEIFAIIFDYLLVFENIGSTNPDSATLFQQVNNLSLISPELNELMEDYFNKIWSLVFGQLVNTSRSLLANNLCQSLLERKQLNSSICKLLTWKQKMMKELLKSKELSIILLSDKKTGRSEFHKKLDPYTSYETLKNYKYSKYRSRQNTVNVSVNYNHIGLKSLYLEYLKCETKLIDIGKFYQNFDNLSTLYS